MNNREEFISKLQAEVATFTKSVSTDNGDWVVKGFIDVAKNIYTISVDTKVISKIMELLIFPSIVQFAAKNSLKMVLSKEQNFYPDITFIDNDGSKFAVDIKSTYRKDAKSVNGMTLGAFTGYFRDRKSSKNISFPYNDYQAHCVFGIIYSRTQTQVDERVSYSIEQLHSINSVACNFEFFVQEKYRTATDRSGSGNTKNIGSVTSIEALKNGSGLFAELGKEVFNDYWMHYLTRDMAKAAELCKPLYTNIKGYRTLKDYDTRRIVCS